MKEEQYEFNGKKYMIRIGQNKEDNFVLLDDSNENDIWFHVEQMPSAHVILINEEFLKINRIPRQVYKRCASICKNNSKAKNTKKCQIMYAYVKNVVKTDVIGQVNVNEYKLIEV